MGGIACREAERADLDAILRIYAQPAFDDGEVLSRTEAERGFERMARYPDYRLYVATEAGRVVGTFALLIMDNLGHRGAPSAVIEDLAVDPAAQGRGIGRRMMQHALERAAAKGCYKAVLSSDLARDRAHRFYESLGFERHGHSYRIRLG